MSNHNSNQVKYKIISNLKIIEYLFLLINLKVKKKKHSVLVFGIIVYEKIRSLIKGRPCRDLNPSRHRHWNDSVNH